MATKKKATKKKSATKKAAKKSEGRQGRPSAFSGKKLYKKEKGNPRREGTIGHKSFGLITNGMSYEKYTELGGRRQDLAFDVAKGYVELRAS